MTEENLGTNELSKQKKRANTCSKLLIETLVSCVKCRVECVQGHGARLRLEKISESNTPP